MIPKRLEDIVENDLLGLVGVAESRQLEFKENLIGTADDEIFAEVRLTRVSRT